MLKSKQGFTLIELLVVIGILAVLAAIAIPAVAGLIDRANVAHDNTNANEMTNSIERFASEYELYRNDVSSIGVTVGEMDTMQSRVYNVVGATTRNELGALEGVNFDKDTLYPLTREDAHKVIGGYMKTTSKTFDPKQSDKCYWYCPSAGIVVVGDSYASASKLNELVVSGKDAKGNDLTPDTQWIDLTCGEDIDNSGNNTPVIPDDDNEISYWNIQPWVVLNNQLIEVNAAYEPDASDDADVTKRYLFQYKIGNLNLDALSAEQLDEYNNGVIGGYDANGDCYTWLPYENASGEVFGVAPSDFTQTLEHSSQSYDHTTDTLTVEFSNGVVLMLPQASTNIRSNPRIQINGQWYKWPAEKSVGTIDGFNREVLQDLVPVSASDVENTVAKQNVTYAIMVDNSPNGETDGIVYGMINLNNETNSSSDVQLQMFFTKKYDYYAMSPEEQEAIANIGGVDGVRLDAFPTYTQPDGKLYIINPTTLSAPSTPTSNMGDYDDTTDIKIDFYDDFALKIHNASQPGLATFEMSFDNGNTWQVVHAMKAG